MSFWKGILAEKKAPAQKTFTHHQRIRFIFSFRAIFWEFFWFTSLKSSQRKILKLKRDWIKIWRNHFLRACVRRFVCLRFCFDFSVLSPHSGGSTPTWSRLWPTKLYKKAFRPFSWVWEATKFRLALFSKFAKVRQREKTFLDLQSFGWRFFSSGFAKIESPVFRTKALIPIQEALFREASRANISLNWKPFNLNR